VPVGSDQKQHIEYARDTAEKFNRTFDETFSLPEAYIPEAVATVPGIDGRKMSKSYHNTIPLFGSDEEIRTQAMRITTDSAPAGEPKDTETCTIFALHKHFSTDDLPEITRRYKDGSMGYKESKERLAENIIAFIAPLREKRATLAAEEGLVERVLAEGAEKARPVASAKMREVREKIGVATP